MKKNPLIIILAIGMLIVVGVVVYLAINPIPSLSTFSEKEAIDLVVAQNPQLSQFQNINSPLATIEAKQTLAGWYLAFITRGSGLPGILEAKCYGVDNNKIVTFNGEFKKESSAIVEGINLETCKPILTEQPATSTVVTLPPPVKNTGLALGELGVFKTISIRPISVEEDSRCPADVVCVWAGTVRLKIQITSGGNTSTAIVTLGKEYVVDGMKITLVSVTPQKNSKINIANKDYRFNFTVTKETPPVVSQPCFKGGCSGEICSDKEGMVSACIWKESFACYSSATCERQSTGQCGWTPTAELNACLQAAQ